MSRTSTTGLSGSGLKSNRDVAEAPAQPVHVIETIPVRGEHRVSAAEIAEEGIPTPAHLRIFPELGRGGMGRIHPATDRNLLRHVALKRLDRELAKVPMYRDGFIAEAQMTGQQGGQCIFNGSGETRHPSWE